MTKKIDSKLANLREQKKRLVKENEKLLNRIEELLKGHILRIKNIKNEVSKSKRSKTKSSKCSAISSSSWGSYSKVALELQR